MSNQPPIVLALPAQGPLATSDDIDVPTLSQQEKVTPRWNLRRRRGRASNSSHPRIRGFSLKLMEDEIDEDIYSLTGELPCNHPRRRPVPLQQMLNVRTNSLTLYPFQPHPCPRSPFYSPSLSLVILFHPKLTTFMLRR
ncbi:hypothetical protein HU200_038402 [Digitaria exilis]|uniref:Uncharacterized protein n=1 Tax=Digitaria exilis TaxID=1010633 RepID=A0A835BKG9_9POAL|nr:hypothetical protein HU200_038402 [Digitaria exilis]